MARGSVTRRGDSWRIAVELQPDPLTGKRVQRFESFVGSKKDADRRLRERLGHANATLVLTTYGHALPGAQAAASQTLEGLLRAAK